MIGNDFFGFIMVFTAHLFGVLDWGYIDTYIKEWYPISRMIGSIFIYLFWISAFYGSIIFLFRKNKNIREWFIGLSLVIAFLGYWLFIGTTVVESRFGYPLFMIFLPFAGIGVENFKVGFSRGNYVSKVKILLIIVILILIMFFLSFVLDYQTGRINWFKILDI